MKPALPRIVIVLGSVSFLNEISSQIVVPLIPLLLVSSLGAGPVAMGLIEGLADAMACSVRLWAGRRSDVLGRRRKIFVLMGYGLSSLSRPLVGLALNWPMVMLLRSLDRVGKGIRSAPRDALVADATSPNLRGRAYGINRAFDYAGAVGGTLLAAAALLWITDRIDVVILLSAIPGLLALILLTLLVRDVPEQKSDVQSQPSPPLLPPSLSWSALSPESRRFLSVLMAFSLTRATESFILLRAHELGLSNIQVLLLWALLCGLQSAAAWAGSGLPDKFSKLAVVTCTWVAYGASLLLFSQVTTRAHLWAVVSIYALLSGIEEGAEKALVSALATDADRGTVFGWSTMIGGLGAIPAGVLFGVIWQRYDANTAFMTYGIMALASAGLLRMLVAQHPVRR